MASLEHASCWHTQSRARSASARAARRVRPRRWEHAPYIINQSRSAYEPDVRLWRALLIGLLAGALMGSLATAGALAVTQAPAAEQGAAPPAVSPPITAGVGQPVYLDGLTLQLLAASRSADGQSLLVSIGYRIEPKGRYVGVSGEALFTQGINRGEAEPPQSITLHAVDQSVGWVTVSYPSGCAPGLDILQYAARPYGVGRVINFVVQLPACM